MQLLSKQTVLAFFMSIGAIFFAFSLDAAPITINSVTGNWVSVTGGQNVSGVGTSQIKWGYPGAGLQNSGYTFVGNAPPIYNIATGTVFNLGTFIHSNFAIPLGTGITGARLATSISISIGSTTLNDIQLAYDFSHFETPNIAPCQSGSGSVCDDIVTMLNNTPFSDTFTVDGVQYKLQVLGFQVGQNQFTQIYTQENKNNFAILKAVITTLSPPPPVTAPEPGTYLLLGSFILATCLLKKRKRTNSS